MRRVDWKNTDDPPFRPFAGGPRRPRARSATAFVPGVAALEHRVLLKSGTSLAFSEAPNPASFGQAVTFVATLTSTDLFSTNAPSGTLTFSYGGNTLGTAALVAGSGGSNEFATATLSGVTTLPVGTDTVSVSYPGDGSYNPNSGTFTETVNGASTATAVTASTATSAYGQPVTFTAAVSATGGGVPTGAVTFKDGPATLGTVNLSGGSASFTTSASNPLSVGGHTITASYAGTANYSASAGTLSGGESVRKASTSTTLATPIAATDPGQPETVSATVAAVAPGAGSPGGSVDFKAVSAGNVTYDLGSASVGAGGSVALTSNVALPSGNYTVTARYSGDTNFVASTSGTGTLSVGLASTVTAVTASTGTSAYGQPVTFTAVVSASGGGTPSGSVTFMDGTSALGTVTLSGGSASFTTSTSAPLSVGGHTITATYGGASSFATSTGTLPGGETVNRASTSTAVVTPVLATAYGQAETVGATVAAVAPGSGSPGGSVDFKAVSAGNVTYDLGSASVGAGGSVSLTSNVVLPAGAYTVTARYSGDANFSASASATAGETVNPAATSTAVASTGSNLVYGNPVTFTAAVSAVAPGAGTPTGTASFSVDGGAGVVVGLSSGSASYTPAGLLTPGQHTLSVTYSGSGNFRVSTGTLAGGVKVTSAPTTTALTVLPGTSVPYTAPVTLKATVTGQPGLSPGGTVTFTLNGAQVGAGALSGGVATFTLPNTLALGAYAVSASYGGDAFDLSSSTGNVAVTVVPAATKVTVAAGVNPVPDHGSVVYTATVAAAPPGTGTPGGGTVQFKVDGHNLGAPVNLVNGKATSPVVSGLTYAGHSVAAAYTPNSNNYLAGTGLLAGGSIFQASTVTTVSAPSTSVYGVPTTLTAAVADAPGETTSVPPTGLVTFYSDGKAVGSASLAGGVAALSTTALAGGAHTITAHYGGNKHWAPSDTQTGSPVNVAPATTTTSAVSVTINGNPVTRITYGTPVTLTAAVANASSLPAPVGAVKFYDTSVSPARLIGAAPLSDGTATLTTLPTALGGSATRKIVAVYAGTTNFATSTSPSAASLSVSAVATGLSTLTESAGSLVYGQPLTLTVGVTNRSGTGVTPTGTVRFYNNAVSPAKPIGSATLVNGVATVSLVLAPGSYAITASFLGNGNFVASGPSNGVAAAVTQAATSTSLASSSTGPITFGTPLTYTATVTNASGTSAVPAGLVIFYLDFNPADPTNTVLGRATLSPGGVASLAGVLVPVGTHTVTAGYLGGVNFLGSRSPAVTQVVNAAVAGRGLVRDGAADRAGG